MDCVAGFVIGFVTLPAEALLNAVYALKTGV